MYLTAVHVSMTFQCFTSLEEFLQRIESVKRIIYIEKKDASQQERSVQTLNKVCELIHVKY